MRFIIKPVRENAKNPIMFKVIDTTSGKTLFRVSCKNTAQMFADNFNKKNSPAFN